MLENAQRDRQSSTTKAGKDYEKNLIVAEYRIPKDSSNSVVAGVDGSLGSGTKFSSSLPAHTNQIDVIPTREVSFPLLDPHSFPNLSGLKSPGTTETPSIISG